VGEREREREREGGREKECMCEFVTAGTLGLRNTCTQSRIVMCGIA